MVTGIVRDAGVADVEMIASTYVAASVAALGPAANLEAIQAAADGAHAMWQPLRRPAPGQWIVVVDTTAGSTGFASFGAVDAHRGHLYALYVDPGSWGIGLGSLLLEASLARLRESAVERVELWVQVENVRAQRFYERRGWLFTGDERSNDRGAFQQMAADLQ